MVAGSSRSARVFEVDELLKNLKLSDKEKEGVFLAKAERVNLPEVKWMAVAKLLTVKGFSEQSLEKTMRAAWNAAREVIFRPIGKNLFLVQAFCLGDWSRIMEEGPWLFRDCALMLEKFDGATTILTVMPNRVQAWVQIHRIPPLFRTEEILKQLAARVGEVDRVELKVVSVGSGEFHRARVKLIADNPLPRVVTFSPEGSESMMLLVKYEKMPKFCDFCGRMGHEYMECGTGEHAVEELQFGNWMLADEETWHPGTPRVRKGFGVSRDGPRDGRGNMGDRGGRSAGRGGGRSYGGGARGGGRGGVWKEKEVLDKASTAPRKRTSGDAGLGNDGDGLEDTTTSPLKRVQEGKERTSERPAAMKQLELDNALAIVPVPPPPPSYVPPKEKKRQKRLDGMSGNDKNSTSEAGSREERRQQQ